jgi:hypothetical protein
MEGRAHVIENDLNEDRESQLSEAREVLGREPMSLEEIGGMEGSEERLPEAGESARCFYVFTS